MNQGTCQFERAVLEATRTGEWTGELEVHRNTCSHCADTAMVAAFLQQPLPEDAANVPPAGLIWWKWQLRQRQLDAEKALRPVRWAERAVIATGSLACAGGLVWVSPLSPALALTAVAGIVVLAAAAGLVWYTNSLARR